MTSTTCPVEGCALSVPGFGSKALASDAASLQVFLPVFERAKEMWLEQFSDEFFAFASMGRELFNRVHGCAHHPIFLTLPFQEVKKWRRAAATLFEGVALLDPEWFVWYWRGVEARGIKPTPSLRAIVRVTERRLAKATA